MQGQKLSKFAQEIQNEVLDSAWVDEDPQTSYEKFTSLVLDSITEEGQWPQHTLSYFRQDKRGEISAWGLDEDRSTLFLAVTDWENTGLETPLPQKTVNDKLKRLNTFFDRAVNDKYELEEGTEAEELCRIIKEEAGKSFKAVEYHLISNLQPSNSVKIPKFPDTDFEISCDIWGLEKIAAMMTSGQSREAIIVDFQERFGLTIPCLPSKHSRKDLDIYSAFLPGSVLGGIYVDYGARLLELNVRTFLQARGKINRGIRDTLAEEPEKFLSFNNGITATASEVEFNESGEISKIIDLQIVNGGQTTASLARAVQDGVDLSKVEVHMKLGAVSKEMVRKVVPEISRYANRQNAVSEADLTANDPFNVALEELAENTPALIAGAKPKYWTYERAKGSYMNMLAEAGTDARRRRLKERHPTNQKFTKTDMAKYYNSWECRPWRVAQGAAKNYAAFMEDIEKGLIPKKPDTNFFQQLIAKAILFKETDTIVRKENFGGYKAEIVTYTIAYISFRLRKQIGWGNIWLSQRLSEEWREAIRITCREIQEFITSQPTGVNLREFCKKESSWKEAQKLKIDFEYAPLLDVKYTKTNENQSKEDEDLNDMEQIAVTWVQSAVDPTVAEKLAIYLELNEVGTKYDRKFAAQIVPKIKLKKEITPQEAGRLAKIWDKAERRGWSSED